MTTRIDQLAYAICCDNESVRVLSFFETDANCISNRQLSMTIAELAAR